ncbi:MAG: hypothetical protein ABW034_17805 [Steroidobacteraceae bacterium]
MINSSMNAYRPMGNFIAYSTTKAALIAFLASDEAAFISGSEYGIDGASTAGTTGV